MRTLLRSLALTFFLLAACSDPLTGRGNVERIDPVPPSWEAVYHYIEGCVGEAGDFSKVEHYLADHIDAPGATYEPAAGGQGDRFYFQRDEYSKWSVYHEYIHHVSGEWGHATSGTPEDVVWNRCDDPLLGWGPFEWPAALPPFEYVE